MASEKQKVEDIGTDDTGEHDAPTGVAVPVERAAKNRAKEDPMLGTIIAGRYRVTKKLGQGGMGVVYKGRQEAVDRDVAIKVLLASLVDDESLVQRFHLEARAASKLTHPNTITIYDFGQHQDILYIAMEYLDGEPLSTPLKAGPMPPPRVLHIMVQALRSLSEAHKKGIVHRDIKPDNIYLTEMGGVHDFVKVLDFGVAKLKTGDNEKTLTKAGMIFGTPKYMSPEQARSQNLDGRSDLYALGVMMYHMLMGRVPFDADDHVTILLKHVTEPPPPFAQLRPDLHVPHEFEQVVMRAMAKDVKERYQSADEMLMALEHLAIQLQIPLGTSAFPIMATGMQPMASVTPPAGLTPGGGIGSPTPIPPASPVTGEIPSTTGGHAALGVRDLGITIPPSAEHLAPPPTHAAPSSGPSTTLIAAIAVIALLAVGGVVAFLVVGSGEGKTDPNTSPQASAPVSAPASVEPPASVEVASAPPPQTHNAEATPPPAETHNATQGAVAEANTQGSAPASAPNDTPPEEKGPAEPRGNVTVHLLSIPPGASVYEGGNLIGTTPTRLERPQSSRAASLTFKLDGFKTITRDASLRKDGSVQAILQRAGGSDKPATSPAERPATAGSSLEDKNKDPYKDPYE